MLFFLKNLIFTGIFNFALFLMLLIGIQNSSSKQKVNLIISETVSLPVSFIVGISFIGGSLTGSISNIIFAKNKNKNL